MQAHAGKMPVLPGLRAGRPRSQARRVATVESSRDPNPHRRIETRLVA